MLHSIADFTELVYSNDLKQEVKASDSLAYNLFKPPEFVTTKPYYFTEVHNDLKLTYK